MPERKPIFYDQDRRRWRRTRRVLEAAGAFFTLVLVVLLVNVIRNRALPYILRADTRGGLHAVRPKQTKPVKPARQGRRRKIAALGKIPNNYDPLRAGCYVSWDPHSLGHLQ